MLAHYDWNDAELLREASWNTNTNAYDIREPLADGHNSTRQLLDSTGSISDVYAFDAWGNQQVNIGGSFNPYRYNSQRLDASGLYYLRARQYSSGIGRFLTHDPVMGDTNNPISQHRYLYAGDDGVNYGDPGGNSFLAMSVSAIGISQTLRATYGAYLVAGSRHALHAGIDAIGLYDAKLRATGYSFPDVTEPLVDVLRNVTETWENASSARRAAGSRNLVIPPNAFRSWDILELNSVENQNRWIEFVVNVSGGTPPLSEENDMRFVVVDGETFHAYVVNYVLYGRAMRLAGYSRSMMRSAVLFAKFGRPTLPWGISAGKEVTSSLAWAEAGYDGWPDVATPASSVVSDQPIPYSSWSQLVPGYADFEFNWRGLVN